MTEKNKVLPSTLYLVATPIGNLDDITLRALKVLRECDFVAAEDTRVTGKLLAAYEIKKPCVTYEEHTKRSAGEIILKRLQEGESCALVTDAGTPGISDPGEDLVRLCLENGVAVVPIPGACAVVNALIVSGFSTRRFVFEGFLQGKDREKKDRLADLAGEKRTLLFYEAPHRLVDTLAMMAEAFGGQRRIALCRELTKLHETVQRGSVSEMIAHYEQTDPRGEYVVVVEGAQDAPQTEQFWEKLSVSAHVDYYVEIGMTKKEAIKAAATDRSVPKNEIYNEVMKK